MFYVKCESIKFPYINTLLIFSIPFSKLAKKENIFAWEQRKLGEVADIIGGGTPSTNNEEYWDGDIDWYSPVEIGEQIYVDESQKKITRLGLQKSSAKILPVGTVLFTSRAGIGNTAILAKEGATNQGFQSIVPSQGKLDSYFIYSCTHKLKRFGEINGAGSTFVEVSGKQMAKMLLLIPNMYEQKKIGNFFRQLDHTYALLQDKLIQYQKLKKAFLQLMFPQNGESVPQVRFANFSTRWEQRKLGEISEVITKGTTPKDKSWTGEVNYVKTESIDPNSGNISVTANTSLEEHKGYLKRSQLKADDVLFSIVGTLGRVGVVNQEDLPANTNQQIAIIRLNNADNRFVFHVLKTPKIALFIKSDATIGAQPSLSLWQINGLEIPYPSIEEQKKISGFLDTLDHLIALYQSKLDQLKKLKSFLLQKMFV